MYGFLKMTEELYENWAEHRVESARSGDTKCGDKSQQLSFRDMSFPFEVIIY